MELWRPAGAATSIAFPMADATGYALTDLTLTSTWVAWSNEQPANTNGNPGFQATANTFTELGSTAVYAGKIAATELPAASPYVMFRFTGTDTASRAAATQYLLIRTASQYSNIVGIQGAAIATPVTAGYMPLDIKQTLPVTTGGSPTDNSIEKALARIYFATQYLDAAISSRSAPATAQTISMTTALPLTGATDNSIGKALAQVYFATAYLDAAVSSRSTYAGGDTAGTTTLLTRVPSAITVTSGAVNLNEAQSLNISTPADNSVGKALARAYFASDYVNASSFADAVLGRTLTRGTSGGRTVGQALMALRDRINITAGTLTVYSTDDTTAEWTATVATESVQMVITDINPA